MLRLKFFSLLSGHIATDQEVEKLLQSQANAEKPKHTHRIRDIAYRARVKQGLAAMVGVKSWLNCCILGKAHLRLYWNAYASMSYE